MAQRETHRDRKIHKETGIDKYRHTEIQRERGGKRGKETKIHTHTEKERHTQPYRGTRRERERQRKRHTHTYRERARHTQDRHTHRDAHA